MRPILIAALLLAAGCTSTVAERFPPETPPDVLLAAALEDEAAGRPDTAAEICERIVEDHGEAPEAEPAAWRIAEIQFAQERWSKSRRAYEDYHTTHPLGRLGELENRLYDLALKQLEDGQAGLFGLGIFPSSGEAFKTFDYLVDNLGNGSRADDALMFRARFRLEDEEYLDALLDLDRILEDYPKSEWTLEARFLKAGAHYSLNRGPEYDRKSLVEARWSYREYVRTIERDAARAVEYEARVAEAKARLTDIDGILAEKNLRIARFYLSLERPASAAVYLKEAAGAYPGTEAGSEAQSLLSTMPGSVQ